uniref:chorismate lyase n=1 Tax=Thaumasiovibrio occultus TaxID=1891184 RepID=UPI000B357302|nr:chorismate lyase [Thaumasiovibrio occultus]
MSEFKRLYKPLLEQVKWSPPTVLGMTEGVMATWLLDTRSLSRRFQQYCQTLSVSLIEQSELAADELSPEERELLGDQPCLVRKVVLFGDDVPWLLGRTLIPFSTLTGQEQDLAQLGEVPLGLRVFQDRAARRDALVLSQVVEGKTRDDSSFSSALWARRSRLWLNEKPMLVSEVFLADAPLYQEE